MINALTLCIGIAATAQCLAVGPSTYWSDIPPPKTVQVDARDSAPKPNGVAVIPGQVVEITAKGTWTNHRGFATYGAGGRLDHQPSHYLCPGANESALIVVITADNGKRTLIPFSKDDEKVTLNQPGVLTFVCNDESGRDGSYQDNEGTLEVTITWKK
jgi:hypothetical protein